MFWLIFLTAVALSFGAPGGRPHNNVGDITWFNVGLGFCGKTNVDSDLIVALSSDFYAQNAQDARGSPSPFCGRRIVVTTPQGKSVTVTVEDKCPGCAIYDLDLSPAAFKRLDDLSVGRIHNVQWHFI